MVFRVFGPYNQSEWQMIPGVVYRCAGVLPPGTPAYSTPSNFHNFVHMPHTRVSLVRVQVRISPRIRLGVIPISRRQEICVRLSAK